MEFTFGSLKTMNEAAFYYAALIRPGPVYEQSYRHSIDRPPALRYGPTMNMLGLDFTTGLAVLGAVLGIMNTWNAINQRRLRLRVRPTEAYSVLDGHHFGIEVINLSSFAVTIAEVGISEGWHSIKRGKRQAVLTPMIIDGGQWPRRLEAREAVSVFFDPNSLVNRERLEKAYARTSCGEVAYGTSPALRALRLRGN
jgi:hypothetical protein